MKFPVCKYVKTEMDLAVAENLDIGFEDHGFLVLFGGFSYGSGAQGIGLTMSSDFLKRFIRVFGVETLQECNGRQIFVEHSSDMIHRLIPVSFNIEEDAAAEFDIFEWSRDVQKRKSRKGGQHDD
jgi:phosphoribosylformylglycinamidine (FGAM) synthase-like amidotransferase family enzyme